MRLPARLHRLAQQEGGFTIVEVIVATVVIVVGLFAAFLALDVALHSSSDVRERELGVALARQVTEDARSIPYSQLSSSTITSTLQSYPGLSNASTSGSSWTIVRGCASLPASGSCSAGTGYTYTISPTLTDINDPKDTTGATDIKQFSVTVSWSTYQGNQHQYTETATISSAGQDPGLQASGLELAAPPWGDAGVSGSQTAPVVTSTGITALQFAVTAPTGTQAIVWTLNGVKQSAWAGSTPSSGTTWTSSNWSLSGVSDGTYTVGAAAEDANGVDGPAVTIPVRLIRNIPSAPVLTGYGFNTNLPSGPSNVAELQWNANPELNVVGYDIYNGTTKICQTSLATSYASCGLNGASVWCIGPLACTYLNPPTAAGTLTYTVHALYYDSSNTLQEGYGTSVTLASGTPTPPGAPTGPGLTTNADQTATITWTPPSGGTPVSFYRIYRDGTGYTSRYDTVAATACTTVCTYTDVNRSEAHTYYVTAVGGTTPGSDMAESTQLYLGNG